MNLTISKNEFELLREFILQKCGIALSDKKAYLIESRLAHLVMESGSGNFGEFYHKIRNCSEYTEKIIDAITTNETLWFRGEKSWKLLKNVLIPECVDNNNGMIRIWSAACSTGQEPYSLGILVNDFCEQHNIPFSRFEIIATDISNSALKIAQMGVYNQLSMNRGFKGYDVQKQKYFTQTGSLWKINDNIRKKITFKQMNLQDTFSTMGLFDIILCKNVAIYFSQDFKADLFSKLSSVMKPHGKLLLGASESILGITDKFKRSVRENCIYYELERGKYHGEK